MPRLHLKTRKKIDQSPGIAWEGGFRKTHESRQEQTREVLGQTSGDGNNGPGHHDAAKEDRGPDSSDDHVGGNTKEDVSDEEDRDTGLVLNVGKGQVLDQG